MEIPDDLDLNEIIDDNLTEMLNESDTFNKVQNSYKKKKEMSRVRNIA